MVEHFLGKEEVTSSSLVNSSKAMQTPSNRMAFVVLYWWQLLADETIIQNNYALKERDCIAFESAPAERRGKTSREARQVSANRSAILIAF